MKTFQIGETATLKATIQRSSANYDPATSVLIYIYLEGSTTALIDGVAMTKETAGVYVYDYQTAALAAGKYRWTCKATDGTKIARKSSMFVLEAA